VRGAIADGADEIDMVINRGAFLCGGLKAVQDEISAVVEACGRRAGAAGVGGRSRFIVGLTDGEMVSPARLRNGPTSTDSGFTLADGHLGVF
jgi:hypothetical protein